MKRSVVILLIVCAAIAASLSAYIYQNGPSLLSQAAYEGDLKTMKFLVFIGVDIDGRKDWTHIPIIHASSKGQIDAVCWLLDNGADPNLTHKVGWTALMSATFYDHRDVVQLLVSRGADKNAEGDSGTALDIAIRENREEIINILKSKRVAPIEK